MYTLFTNNCQKLDPEIFIEKAKFYDSIHVDSSVKQPHIFYFCFKYGKIIILFY